MTFRWAQQVRTWIYSIVEVLIVFRSFSSKATATEFIIFMLVGALFSWKFVRCAAALFGLRHSDGLVHSGFRLVVGGSHRISTDHVSAPEGRRHNTN